MNTNHSPNIVAIIVIFIISSLFAPVILLYLLQDAIFHAISKWLFAAPFSAYVTCIIGILWNPLVLTLYLLVRSYRDKQNKKTNKWAFYGLSSLSIVICYFAVMNYYYINEEGITYHHLFQVNETHYAWDEMTEVNQIVKSKDGITYTDRIEFIMNNHKKINIPYSSQYLEISGRIQETLRKNGIPFQMVPDSS